MLDSNNDADFVGFLATWLLDRSAVHHHQWLYRDNPHGQALTWVALLGPTKRIIGCTSIFPRRARLRGSSILASFGGDTYIHPDFRRRGIAQALHEVSVRDMSKFGIRVHYGFPVPINFKAFTKCGALHPGDFLDIRLPLDGNLVATKVRAGSKLPLVAKLVKSAFEVYLDHKVTRFSLEDAALRPLQRFDSQFDSLFEVAANRHGVCCIRDPSYLEWRFLRHPIFRYSVLSWQCAGTLRGYAVLDLQGNRCHVVDFLVKDDAKEALAFISALVRFAIDHKKLILTFRVNPNGSYTDLFRRVGFRDGRERFPLMVLTAPGDPDAPYLGRLENWYLTPGDRDVG